MSEQVSQKIEPSNSTNGEPNDEPGEIKETAAKVLTQIGLGQTPQRLNDKQNQVINDTPKSLPVIIVSSEDPKKGEYSKQVAVDEKQPEAESVKERFVDPVIKSLDDALCREDKTAAVAAAQSILNKVAQKHGKNSTEYINSLYKVASTLHPTLSAVEITVSPRHYKSAQELAAPHWQELIATSDKLYGKEANYMPMVGDACWSLAHNSSNPKEKFQYYERATEIYENILQRRPALGFHHLDLLDDCYNYLKAEFHERGQTTKAEQINRKHNAMAPLWQVEYDLSKKEKNGKSPFSR
jgi:hypothetical protein